MEAGLTGKDWKHAEEKRLKQERGQRLEPVSRGGGRAAWRSDGPERPAGACKSSGF